MNDKHQFDKDSFFYLLDEIEKKLVMERLQKTSYSVGEYVFKEGDDGEKLYIVRKGSVSLIKSIGSDLDKMVLIAAERSIFGEFSFIDGSITYTAFCQQNTPCFATGFSGTQHRKGPKARTHTSLGQRPRAEIMHPQRAESPTHFSFPLQPQIIPYSQANPPI